MIRSTKSALGTAAAPRRLPRFSALTSCGRVGAVSADARGSGERSPAPPGPHLGWKGRRLGRGLPATRASLEPRVSDAAAPGAYRGLEPGSECEGRSGSSARAGDSGPRVRGKRRAPGSSASPGSPSNPSALQPLCRPDDPNTLAGAGRSREAAPGFRRCSLPCGVSAGCSGPACAAVRAENR